MSYKARTLASLIEAIKQNHLLLPHIQRPFVWEREQMRRLFDSLMRNYPIQTLLFWRTKSHIKARRFLTTVEWDPDLSRHYDRERSKAGVDKMFVLDGQQRLQTLYALFAGSVRNEKQAGAEEEAWFDLTSGTQVDAEGVLYPLQFSAGPLELPCYRLRDLLEKDAQQSAWDIGDRINAELDGRLHESPEQQSARRNRVQKNLAMLSSLLLEEKYFWIEELDGVNKSLPYERILEIFIRVNSGGTKLSSSDLMFAAMKEGWEQVEENIEGVVHLLNEGKLEFDKTFALKCLVVAHGHSAELGPDKFGSQQEEEQLLKKLSDNWPQAEKTFAQLRDFIRHDLALYSDKVIRSYSCFVPLFDYLFHNPAPDERNRRLMRAYYYKSQLFNWYSSQTDGLINVLHGIVGKKLAGFPLPDIKTYFLSRGYTVELAQAHLTDMRLRYIVLNLIYVARFGSSPFDVKYEGNEPQIDHIYPQSSLRSQLGLGTVDINHLGNYRFIGAKENLRKRAEKPAEYFSRLAADSVDISRHLLVTEFSSDPKKLAFDVQTYLKFRDSRLGEILKISAEVVNAELPPATPSDA